MPHDDFQATGEVKFQHHDYAKMIRLMFYDHNGKMASVVLSKSDFAKMLERAKDYI